MYALLQLVIMRPNTCSYSAYINMCPVVIEGKVRAKIGVNAKLLEQPIPASFLKLEKRIRELAVTCRNDDRPTVLKETVFKLVLFVTAILEYLFNDFWYCLGAVQIAPNMDSNTIEIY